MPKILEKHILLFLFITLVLKNLVYGTGPMDAVLALFTIVASFLYHTQPISEEREQTNVLLEEVATTLKQLRDEQKVLSEKVGDVRSTATAAGMFRSK